MKKRKSSLNNSEGPSNASNVVFGIAVVVMVVITGCCVGSYKLLKAAGRATVKGVRMML